MLNIVVFFNKKLAYLTYFQSFENIWQMNNGKNIYQKHETQMTSMYLTLKFSIQFIRHCKGIETHK